MAGQRILAPLIKVRILVPQLVRHGPHRLAVRTPASHVGNTGSIPVGVTVFPSENGQLGTDVSEESETNPKFLEGTRPGGRGGRGSPMRRRSVWPRST